MKVKTKPYENTDKTENTKAQGHLFVKFSKKMKS